MLGKESLVYATSGALTSVKIEMRSSGLWRLL